MFWLIIALLIFIDLCATVCLLASCIVNRFYSNIEDEEILEIVIVIRSRG